MGLFNFGGSKQSSESFSEERSNASAFNLGLGYGYSGSLSDSQSRGASRSLSQGQSTSRQAIAFEDVFAQLYGGASNVAGRLASEAGGLTDQANLLFSGGLGFLDTLAGGADTEYLASRLTGDNAVLDEQIGALGEDIGRFFREEVNPAITSAGVATGTLGGGRQGVAQGRAAEAAAREFQRGATALRSADVAARDAAAAQLQQGRIAGAGAGLSAIPSLFGVAQGGFGAELAPYQALAGIVGGPTVLTQAQATDFAQSSAEEIAAAISRAFGENFSLDFGTSESSSYATSRTKSKGKSFDLGFG